MRRGHVRASWAFGIVTSWSLSALGASIAQFAPPPPSSPPPTPISPAVPPVPPLVPELPHRASDDDFGDRTLKGHTFLYPAFFDSAFVATYIGVRAELRFLNVPDVATQ